eukprot:Gb_35135 [translate_table: standard]
MKRERSEDNLGNTDIHAQFHWHKILVDQNSTRYNSIAFDGLLPLIDTSKSQVMWSSISCKVGMKLVLQSMLVFEAQKEIRMGVKPPGIWKTLLGVLSSGNNTPAQKNYGVVAEMLFAAESLVGNLGKAWSMYVYDSKYRGCDPVHTLVVKVMEAQSLLQSVALFIYMHMVLCQSLEGCRLMTNAIYNSVKGVWVLWTGVGAQLARDVPFSAICWTTLEPKHQQERTKVHFGDREWWLTVESQVRVQLSFQSGVCEGGLAVPTCSWHLQIASSTLGCVYPVSFDSLLLSKPPFLTSVVKFPLQWLVPVLPDDPCNLVGRLLNLRVDVSVLGGWSVSPTETKSSPPLHGSKQHPLCSTNPIGLSELPLLPQDEEGYHPLVTHPIYKP